MIHGFMTFSRFAAGAVLCACATTGMLAQKPSKSDQKAEAAAAQAQQQEYATVVRLADSAMAGQPSPSDVPIQFQNDFLRAQGGAVWVPMTLTIDPAKLPSSTMTLYTRVAPRGMTAPPPPEKADKADKNDKRDKGKTDRNKKNDKSTPAAPTYPYEDIAVLDVKQPAPGQPIRIVRGFGVPPGTYDLYLVLHERSASAAAPAKTTVLKQSLDVPNYSNGEFSASSILLAERVDTLPAPLPPDQQSERPYAFGANEIIVSPDRRFKKSQELLVLMQVYNVTTSAEKKFNLEATYTFFQKDANANGEKRFNNTEPQSITSETTPGVDPSGPAGVPAGLGIPLQSFPEGNYRLEIKITDKLNAKVLTQSVNFTVAS